MNRPTNSATLLAVDADINFVAPLLDELLLKRSLTNLSRHQCGES